MNIDMNMNNRIKEVRLSMKLSQAKFAQKIGFSQGAIRDVELGKCGVSDRLILSMSKELGISEKWLRTGEGDMHAQTNADAVAQAIDLLADTYKMNSYEKAMMRNYFEMTPEARQGFQTFLKEIAPAMKAEADEMVAEDRAEYISTKTSNLDTTAEELHEMIDELYETKAEEPSA